MRPCDDIRAHLKAYVDGELSLMARARVRRHLRSCSGCAGELAEIQRLGRELRSMDPPPPSPALRSRILAALPDTSVATAARRRTRGPWRFGSLALAGATMAGLVLFVLARRLPPVPVLHEEQAPRPRAAASELRRADDTVASRAASPPAGVRAGSAAARPAAGHTNRGPAAPAPVRTSPPPAAPGASRVVAGGAPGVRRATGRRANEPVRRLPGLSGAGAAPGRPAPPPALATGRLSRGSDGVSGPGALGYHDEGALKAGETGPGAEAAPPVAAEFGAALDAPREETLTLVVERLDTGVVQAEKEARVVGARVDAAERSVGAEGQRQAVLTLAVPATELPALRQRLELLNAVPANRAAVDALVTEHEAARDRRAPGRADQDAVEQRTALRSQATAKTPAATAPKGDVRQPAGAPGQANTSQAGAALAPRGAFGGGFGGAAPAPGIGGRRAGGQSDARARARFAFGAATVRLSVRLHEVPVAAAPAAAKAGAGRARPGGRR